MIGYACNATIVGTVTVRADNPVWYATKCQEIFVICEKKIDSRWVSVTGFFEEYIVFQTPEMTFS